MKVREVVPPRSVLEADGLVHDGGERLRLFRRPRVVLPGEHGEAQRLDDLVAHAAREAGVLVRAPNTIRERERGGEELDELTAGEEGGTGCFWQADSKKGGKSNPEGRENIQKLAKICKEKAYRGLMLHTVAAPKRKIVAQ